ncbi:aminoacyl-histidine dipeptidase [Microcoleus sp. PH2017_28_MFU_U_A]|uniref:aminoacyl-histidine dipeptidase n=1 Tax=Microcoleus sp. PH2017_28_MFU_U_A TaxID=2798838 RepID=UPI001D94AED4|nr:aminoacyl-histidine dipeptidase [Microcoleus sp. PH2017_28_MFU_U_A]MCC3589197.1 aminoacyl-histidine dipeptidase [Microcoleus sp. PH2017_28_MFU_U_A]
MRVTEKVQKTNATHTAKAHKTQIKALDKCISYNDKLRLMVLEVLREESGRELASVARFNGGQFDWETHNAQFRADYSETPLKELMRAGRILYGLTDMDAIRDRRAKHRGIRNQRLARQSSGVASSSQSVHEEVDVADDDINDLD